VVWGYERSLATELASHAAVQGVSVGRGQDKFANVRHVRPDVFQSGRDINPVLDAFLSDHAIEQFVRIAVPQVDGFDGADQVFWSWEFLFRLLDGLGRNVGCHNMTVQRGIVPAASEPVDSASDVKNSSLGTWSSKIEHGLSNLLSPDSVELQDLLVGGAGRVPGIHGLGDLGKGLFSGHFSTSIAFEGSGRRSRPCYLDRGRPETQCGVLVQLSMSLAESGPTQRPKLAA